MFPGRYTSEDQEKSARQSHTRRGLRHARRHILVRLVVAHLRFVDTGTGRYIFLEVEPHKLLELEANVKTSVHELTRHINSGLASSGNQRVSHDTGELVVH